MVWLVGGIEIWNEVRGREGIFPRKVPCIWLSGKEISGFHALPLQIQGTMLFTGLNRLHKWDGKIIKMKSRVKILWSSFPFSSPCHPSKWRIQGNDASIFASLLSNKLSKLYPLLSLSLLLFLSSVSPCYQNVYKRSSSL